MTFYEVFGGVLQSDIDFPELTAIDADCPNWTLRRRVSLPPLPDVVLVGEEQLVGGVAARLERGGDRYRLRFDDTGTFDVARDGSRIGWLPATNANAGIVRADILGRVLSVALHAAGDFCLHASAAEIGGRAVAFVGPRGYGKSTLTMALVTAGARLVADDTVRLTGTPPRVAVAVPALRLREDAATRFGIAAPAEVGDKVIVRDAPLPKAPLLPLESIYLLSPYISDGTPPQVVRRRLGALEATLALVRHGKIAPLLGGAEAASVLPRVSAVVREVPVFILAVPRDLTILADAAARIISWHAAVKAPLPS
jgi:hypothetical protein